MAGARSHDVIEVRFSGERATESFRVGGKPLTIRAARGFMPILVAANNAQPLILVDAPLTLEGLTLWRRGPNPNFAPLTSVENAPLNLLNCRVLRSSHQGEDMVVGGRLRLSTDGEPRRYRPLLAFQHGSSGTIQNCVVAGTAASCVSLRSAADLPTQVEFNDSLVVTDFGIHLNAESETGASFSAVRSVFVTRFLLNASRPTNLKDLAVSWRDSVLDRTPGGNLVHPGGYDGERTLRAIRWSEANVVYAGRGGYANTGKGMALSGEEWREAMQLSPNSHRVVDGQAFPETCFRSCLSLSVADLDEAVVHSPASGRPRGDGADVGQGISYDRFRRTEAYRQWQREVRASALAWEQRHPRRVSE